jgi:hypothetical protein
MNHNQNADKKTVYVLCSSHYFIIAWNNDLQTSMKLSKSPTCPNFPFYDS